MFLKVLPLYDTLAVFRTSQTHVAISVPSLGWTVRVPREIALESSPPPDVLEKRMLSRSPAGVLDGHLCFHVDDFSMAGTACFKSSVVKDFCKRYSVPELRFGEAETKLCGVWKKQEVKGEVLEKIKMHQRPYAESREMISEDGLKRRPGAALTSQELTSVQSVGGAAMWLAVSTNMTTSRTWLRCGRWRLSLWRTSS